MHPILDALDGTPHEWIKKLLFTFNEGNIGKFEALAPLFRSDAGTAVIGSWIVGGEPAGLCVREADGPITTNRSRFVPHVIDP